MNEWSLFEIEPTSDKRAIKRAYAKLIKTIDPAKEPQRFQKVREAYDYLLDYGRFYVEEESVELSENAALEEQDDEQLTHVEASKAYSQLSSQELILTELDVPQETESKKGDLSVVDQLSIDEVILEEPFKDNFEEQKIALDSGPTQLVYSGIEFQSQELATDFQHKTRYQSANEFIEKLTELFDSGSTVEKSDWIDLIEGEEFQFFDVIELLRVDIFGFLVEQIEKCMEVGNQPEQLKLKLLRERLPKDFEWLTMYLAEHFDWRNTELILSNHFSGEQMKMVGQFYLKNKSARVVETKESGSNAKYYFFWFMFLFVLIKAFSAMENDSGKGGSTEPKESERRLLESIRPVVFCSHYRLINSDERAEKCEQRLLPTENKKRLILALYWLNQFDSNKKDNKPKELLDKSLNKGFELIQQASDNHYIPATNLLAWMKLGKHYQQQDIVTARLLLEQSTNNGDNVSTVALGIGYYVGLWGQPDPEKANQILQSIDINDSKNSANLRYALAASYWFNVVKPKVEIDREKTKQQLSLVFLDNSESADLQYVNNLAWFFATVDSESNDPVLALNLARQFQPEYRNSQKWQHHDTLAASYAARGNFDMARESIDQAAKLLNAKYPEVDNSERLEAEKILAAHRLLFEQNQTIKVKADSKTMRGLLTAGFDELMRIDLQNLPE